MQLIAVQFAACTRDVDVLQWVVDPGLTETTLSPHCGLSGATLRGNISPKFIDMLQSVRAASPDELRSHKARTILAELTMNGRASLDDIICSLRTFSRMSHWALPPQSFGEIRSQSSSHTRTPKPYSKTSIPLYRPPNPSRTPKNAWNGKPSAPANQSVKYNTELPPYPAGVPWRQAPFQSQLALSRKEAATDSD
ncbi:hypothetical protein Hypma_006834 [Hypsizygus marmoreus]|uniref:Uncharacterized protein n=1 Tax=Hypsizygus marmoreus TaxID=39966 RepID=A0A369JX89_HYPMA|nr:hypothetical protein Hypma_006834 [Hypsizygus marmoreus]